MYMLLFIIHLLSAKQECTFYPHHSFSEINGEQN